MSVDDTITREGVELFEGDPGFAHLRNGTSTRAAATYKDPFEGEGFDGVVTERSRSRAGKFSPDGTEYLDVKIAAGRLRGVDLEPGTWSRLWCSQRVLREWLRRDNPRPGDKVSVRFLGLRELPDGTTMADWICGCERSSADELGEEWS
jgi:hypothetical protein